MRNFIWRIRNAAAKVAYIVETFGMRALFYTVFRKLKTHMGAGRAPALFTSSNQFNLFPVPHGPRRLTLIVETLDRATPEALIGEVVDFCETGSYGLRIVTRVSPAQTDIFCRIVRKMCPTFGANVDFSFVDRANPFGELSIGAGDVFWRNEAASVLVPHHLLSGAA